MQSILAYIGDTHVRPGQLPDRFLPVSTSLFPPGYHPLQPLDLAQVSFEGMWVLDPHPIAERRQRQNPQIHPYYWLIGSFGVGYLPLHLHRHKPASGPFTYCGAQDVDILHRQVTALFQSQASQARQLDGMLKDMNGTRQPESTHTVLLRLEFREACQDLSACFLLLHPPEEVSISLVQVSQRFLGGTLGHFVHPG